MEKILQFMKLVKIAGLIGLFILCLMFLAGILVSQGIFHL